MGKKPSWQFYPGDWMKDPALRSVSLSARGLWIDMLCLMHESGRRGYLQVNGKPVSNEQLARMTGCSTEQVSLALQELMDSGVASASEHGTFSRRMVRDESKRLKCAEAGKLGGNPTLIHQGKGASKGEANRNSTPSSSTSVNTYREREGAGENETPLGSGNALPTPPWWPSVREAMDAWAQTARGCPMQASLNEPRTVLASFTAQARKAPIAGNDPSAHFVPVVLALMARGTKFGDRIQYAMKCVDGELERWRQHGVPTVQPVTGHAPAPLGTSSASAEAGLAAALERIAKRKAKA